mmetsp:Transcript_51777/g.149272  ORF Transcript_51777/g.149272 Transcript_51777/m.149272 type:complete len:270 (+) Transcript_51777:1106-1915(+)
MRTRPLLHKHVARLEVAMHYRWSHRVQVAQGAADLERDLEPLSVAASKAASEVVEARAHDQLVDQQHRAEVVVGGRAEEGRDVGVPRSANGANLQAERPQTGGAAPIRITQRLCRNGLTMQPGDDHDAEAALAQDPGRLRGFEVGGLDPPMLLAAELCDDVEGLRLEDVRCAHARCLQIPNRHAALHPGKWCKLGSDLRELCVLLVIDAHAGDEALRLVARVGDEEASLAKTTGTGRQGHTKALRDHGLRCLPESVAGALHIPVVQNGC